MKVALDVMGGDYAPTEIIEGALLAVHEIKAIEKLYLVGKKDEITKVLSDRYHSKIEIVFAEEVIGMNEHPGEGYRNKKNSSIVVATRLVKDGLADVVISAGSTGAQLAASLFELGRIKGIKRPAIGVFLPTAQGDKLLLDAGANTVVTEEILYQFSLMGSMFYSLKNKVQNPKIALINNGEEENKGTDLLQNTWKLLKKSNQINFIGNAEGKDIAYGIADVYVCDGFTGNIILKTMEGLGKTIFSMLKNEINSSFRFKIGGYLLKPIFFKMRNTMDSNRIGGAPLLGITGLSIVCHGSSNRKAILAAFYSALICYEENLIEKIQTQLVSMREE